MDRFQDNLRKCNRMAILGIVRPVMRFPFQNSIQSGRQIIVWGNRLIT
jgi:hypothetical protein